MRRRAILAPVDRGPIIDDLRRTPLFARLDQSQLAKLATIAHPQRLAGGETVFLQGDLADAFFLLSEGAVKVFKTFRDGRSATLRHVAAGHTFAESVLFAETYPASAEAMERQPRVPLRHEPTFAGSCWTSPRSASCC